MCVHRRPACKEKTKLTERRDPLPGGRPATSVGYPGRDVIMGYDMQEHSKRRDGLRHHTVGHVDRGRCVPTHVGPFGARSGGIRPEPSRSGYRAPSKHPTVSLPGKQGLGAPWEAHKSQWEAKTTRPTRNCRQPRAALRKSILGSRPVTHAQARLQETTHLQRRENGRETPLGIRSASFNCKELC